ncbi:lipid droplet-regulating VLDL assembly factor AUP1 [Papilio machaon]|uniref:lipid droplet-regulating VLDL assembly factor AUP1 n=1 Tax=Papilio machaon TaxID=76193 RepID=UPI001E6652A3|nr:lipid droplet-regulating VLDL assembly factor AUP1 [Papilio machaon]
MTLTVDKLFNKQRFTGDNLLQFLFYLPLGLLLMTLRIILGLILWIAAIILPDKSGVRQMLSTLACWTFGVYVKLKGNRDLRCSVMVANYVSCLDSLAASHVLGTISLRKWKVPPFFASTLGIRNASQFIRKQHFAESPSKPILLQPEGAPTNGRALLKFTDWPFPIGNRVQPIAINVERPMSAVCVRGGGGLARQLCEDALWYLTAPATVYTLRALPPLERGSDDDAAFSKRIAQTLADALQIPATEYRWEDLPGERTVGGGGSVGGGRGSSGAESLSRMARKVREVLPAVPERDVLRDLAKTHSVDVTITNFLEGITPYTPEVRPPTAQAQAPPPAEPRPGPSRDPPKYVIPAPTGVFPKTAKERQLSFQERKEQMIAEARKKYIEKHGIDVAINC